MMYTLRQDAPAGWGYITAVATDESAGAVTRLTWNNITALGGVSKEFINNTDHGRLLQASFTTNSTDSEAYNPTEGGSLYDGGIMSPSTSRLLAVSAVGNVLKTTTQMAFWKPQGTWKRSNFILQKQLTLGYNGVWNAIEVVETLYTPENESLPVAQFEVLTGYMPSTFSAFETFNRTTKTTSPLSDGPGEQPYPVVLSTPDGGWAMGAWAPAGTPGGGYGRWKFGDCVKWNVVTRDYNLPAGSVLKRRVLCAIGSKSDVVNTLSVITG